MNVKRYFAPTAREALRALKEALGPDAIVLSNRAVEGGVEILALPGEAVSALQAANRAAVAAKSPPAANVASARSMPAAAPASNPAEAVDSDFRVSLSALAASAARNAARPAASSAAAQAQEMRPFSPPRIETSDFAPRPRQQPLQPAAVAPAARAASDEFGSARMR